MQGFCVILHPSLAPDSFFLVFSSRLFWLFAFFQQALHKFPKDKKVKLFRVTVSANRTEYVATNDLNQSSIDEVISECKLRWKIEEFHREIKQLTGIESCQCRRASIQKNHIACALLVWVFLTNKAKKVSQTVYQLKASLLADYLSQELKHPSLKLSFI